jgi:hypothetical protein
MIRYMKISFIIFLLTAFSTSLKSDDKFYTNEITMLAENLYQAGTDAVVINEIHYDPDIRTELIEFIELHNISYDDIDIGGWYFSDGISYQFPVGTILPSGGYVVITEDPELSYSPVTVVEKYAANSSFVYGPFEGRLSNEGEEIVLRDAEGNKVDEVDYQLGFPWPTVGDSVPSDTLGNGHSIQLVNPYVDNDLGGSWRSAYPTPTRLNSSVYIENTPPHIRQVKHSPKQPKSDELVTIAAKVTDSDGVATVELHYQLVDPGNYIPITLPVLGAPPTKTNPDYENPVNWISVAMRDDGLNGDTFAGDDIYTVQMPRNLQTNRLLVRYHIFIMDNTGRSLMVPYADDPQPNFAYFVYDGVPAWSGAIRPGSSGSDGEVVEYSTEVLTSLPVYHLISRAVDWAYCQWNEGRGHAQRWDDGLYHFVGTLVYDGEVYDHVPYHIRGQWATFRWGKNRCKFNFNRGHYFQARDDYGNKYDNKWNNLTLGAGGCPWWQYPHPGGNWDVGTGGMFLNECLSFRLYNLAGVPASKTNYFHFRVIDEAREAGPTQYDGDFWGLFFAIEEPDGRFLDEHGLEDGNFYKMEVGDIDKRYQGPTQVADNSDVIVFIDGQNRSSTQAWWESNVNLDQYYSYKSVGIAINNSDPRPQENCLYYCNPIDNRWSIHPWDLDLTYEWATHYTDWEHIQYCLNHSALNISYKNRARELLDLLFSGDQVDQLVDEIASVISDPNGGPSFIDAERAMWENHPRINYPRLWYGNNEFFESLPNGYGKSETWANMIEYYKKFLSPIGMSDFLSGKYGVHALVGEAVDVDIPDTPTITYTGSAEYPKVDLTFETNSFSDLQGSGTFTAMKWRIAEVEPNTSVSPSVEWTASSIMTLLESESTGWRYFPARSGEPSSPVDAWRRIDFDDRTWLVGQTSIGYSDNDDNTILDDMRNNYSSVYLRRRFTVSNLNEIAKLQLDVYVDDGCIIWINGTEVARLHVGAGFKAYNSLTDEDYISEATWETVSLDRPESFLVEGENVIAIHVLNSSLDSSDLSIDIELSSTGADNEEPDDEQVLQNHSGRYTARPKYEIDDIWESEEIVSPEATAVTIPASVVEAGHTYRVRCRMKDNTGRWSHWSAPVQFVAGEMQTEDLLSDLRITELMYNPTDSDTTHGELDVNNESFEFIELQNIGDETINLYLVSFTNGIDFTFPNMEIPSGEYVVVVQNCNAFESRYGTEVPVAGEYTGKLSNGGERIELEDGNGRVILDFEFQDDWYDATDGEGYSLTIIDPANPDPNSWNQKESWRASSNTGGSPGRDDSGITP